MDNNTLNDCKDILFKLSSLNWNEHDERYKNEDFIDNSMRYGEFKDFFRTAIEILNYELNEGLKFFLPAKVPYETPTPSHGNILLEIKLPDVLRDLLICLQGNSLKSGEKLLEKLIFYELFCNIYPPTRSIKKSVEESVEKVKYLEDKYQTLERTSDSIAQEMNISEPAKHWEQLAEKSNTHGWWFTIAASSWAIIIIAFISLILYWKPPECFLGDIWTTNSIRGALLLLLLSSIALYILHILVKFAVSSFHLARDARERYQLTYVYLAVLKNVSLSEKERERICEIVFQAIFSRSDTGLLKGENHLTMPSVMGRILDCLKKE